MSSSNHSRRNIHSDNSNHCNPGSWQMVQKVSWDWGGVEWDQWWSETRAVAGEKNHILKIISDLFRREWERCRELSVLPLCSRCSLVTQGCLVNCSGTSHLSPLLQLWPWSVSVSLMLPQWMPLNTGESPWAPLSWWSSSLSTWRRPGFQSHPAPRARATPGSRSSPCSQSCSPSSSCGESVPSAPWLEWRTPVSGLMVRRWECLERPTGSGFLIHVRII